MEIHDILITGKRLGWGGVPKISGTCFEDPYDEAKLQHLGVYKGYHTVGCNHPVTSPNYNL